MKGRPAPPRLHVLVPDPVLQDADYRARLGPVAEAGGVATALQLRARRTSARRLHEVAEWLMERAGRVGSDGQGERDHATLDGPTVVVNDRVDVALAVGADGVHLREDSMPPGDARALVGASVLLGRSVHATEAAQALDRQVDYLILGAVFATRSHPGRAPLDSRAVTKAVESSRAPVVAVGGIDPARATSLARTGVHGVAVMSGVWQARDPARAVHRYLEALIEGTP